MLLLKRFLLSMELIDTSRSAQQNKLGNAELKATTAAAFLAEGKDQFPGSQSQAQSVLLPFYPARLGREPALGAELGKD